MTRPPAMVFTENLSSRPKVFLRYSVPATAVCRCVMMCHGCVNDVSSRWVSCHSNVTPPNPNRARIRHHCRNKPGKTSQYRHGEVVSCKRSWQSRQAPSRVGPRNTQHVERDRTNAVINLSASRLATCNIVVFQRRGSQYRACLRLSGRTETSFVGFLENER